MAINHNFYQNTQARHSERLFAKVHFVFVHLLAQLLTLYLKNIYHCETLPMLYVEIFKKKKNKISLDFFLNIFAHHINCGYTLGPPRRGGSNGYPQCFVLDEK